jgi:Zn-dependent M28 family amino/carboxypeptidase
MKVHRILALVLVFSLALAQDWESKLTPDRQAAIGRISVNSLKGHLSFIASDLLEGRGTPSRGLDLAAEYIAAQFRRAGLEPAGDDGYFQTSTATARGSETPQKVRNVVGVLRGSDPALKDTCVIVSAHYDHLGVRANQEGDNIYNGANDDGSGTVSVIELASALSELKAGPKRSIVFICFFGEERGMLGSTFYGRNPVFPLAKTVAAVNLEHMGRTDDSEGERKGEMVMTGFDFSDMGQTFADAAKQVGIKVSKHPTNSDSFFGRSDNVVLARLGVPSHTLCTAFIFPEYHQPGDHWDKIDYDNLARVLKGAALGILTIANSAREPRWNADNPKAARYLEAWKTLRAGSR